MKKLICDICKKPVGQSGNNEIIIEPGYGSYSDNMEFEYDICNNCIDRVINLLNEITKD